VRKLASAQTVQGLTDGQLLRAFIVQREETAFSELVRRHGRLVLHVCRQVLRHEQDAEDAFQATFLVLAKKAESIVKRDSLSSWLYGVAYRTALKAKSITAKRNSSMNWGKPMGPCEPPMEAALRELQDLLHEEVNRLPLKLRAPFVLCCMEGKSQAEAAQLLGWKGGTLSGRLAQARERLRHRLVGRGVALSTVLGAFAISSSAVSAAVPATLADATSHSAFLLVTGESLGTISAPALSLAESVTRAMALTNFKVGVTFAVAATILATGIGLAAYRAIPTRPATSDLQNPQNPEAKVNDRPNPAGKLQVRTDRYGDSLPVGAVARMGTSRLRQGTLIGQRQLVFTSEGNIWTAESPEPAVHWLRGGACQFEKYIWNGIAPEPVLHLWDRASGKELMRRVGPNGTQAYFLTAQSEKLLVIGGKDDVIQVWEGASGEELRRLRVSKNTRPVALSGDFQVLTTIDFDPNSHFPAKTIRLWEMTTGRELAKVETSDQYLEYPVFSPDGRMFVTGWGRREAPTRVWETATGKELFRIVDDKGSTDWRTAAFSPDGKVLALGRVTDGVLFWDLAAAKEIRYLPTKKRIFRIVYSPDGKTLAGRDGDDNVLLWDVATGKELHRLKDDENYSFSELAFSVNGKMLATWGKTNAFAMWDVATGRRLHGAEGSLSAIKSLSLCLGGTAIVAETWHQNGTPVWDVTTGKLTRRLCGHLNGVTATAVSPDGATLATGSWDGKIRLWDLTTGNELRQMAADERAYVGPISFSPDGKRLISTGCEGRLRFFEVATGKEDAPVHVPPYPQSLVSWFITSPDSRTLALMSRIDESNTIRLWNATTGKELFTIPNSAGSWAAGFYQPGAGTCSFSPDGKTLAAVTGNLPKQGIGIWELATGQERCRFAAPAGGISSITFSLNGRLLALGGYDQIVHIVEVGTGKVLTQCRGHSGWVLCVAFSPDGQTLVSGSSDTTILIWKLSELLGHKRKRESDLSAKALEALWDNLGGEKATEAHAAIWKLAGAPQQAVPLLQKRLQAVTAPDPNRLARLFADLDSNRFSKRQNAMQEFEELGELAAPALRQAMTGKISAEVRRRIEQLLAKISDEILCSQKLQALRGLEVLELIGTPEAEQVLWALSQGASGALITREAQASMERLAKRAPIRPRGPQGE
jgi:RNA polymerase sigma factor (sigma-70 family)